MHASLAIATHTQSPPCIIPASSRAAMPSEISARTLALTFGVNKLPWVFNTSSKVCEQYLAEKE